MLAPNQVQRLRLPLLLHGSCCGWLVIVVSSTLAYAFLYLHFLLFCFSYSTVVLLKIVSFFYRFLFNFILPFHHFSTSIPVLFSFCLISLFLFLCLLPRCLTNIDFALWFPVSLHTFFSFFHYLFLLITFHYPHGPIGLFFCFFFSFPTFVDFLPLTTLHRPTISPHPTKI